MEVGWFFRSWALGGDVFDRDAGKSLGSKPIEKLRVKVGEVFPQFLIVERIA